MLQTLIGRYQLRLGLVKGVSLPYMANYNLNLSWKMCPYLISDFVSNRIISSQRYI